MEATCQPLLEAEAQPHPLESETVTPSDATPSDATPSDATPSDGSFSLPEGYKISGSERKKYIDQKEKAKFASPEDECKYAMSQFRKCSKCNEIKALIYFNGNTSGRDGFDKDGYRLRRPECSVCTKAANAGKKVAEKIAKDAGISYKAPEGSCCAICKSTTKKLVFDHCHEKEVFRGYLCDPCNRSLGVLGDNIEGLIKCINYLQKSEKKTIYVGEDGMLSINP